MHRFSLLIEGCVAFIHSRVEDTVALIERDMRHHATSIQIKNLQSLRLQYAISAVGMFSIFEADLQKDLEASNGFAALRAKLKELSEYELLERFEKFYLAINVLKHGDGTSYEKLLAQADVLPFTIKRRGQDFFEEGDCTEIDTLVLADGAFVSECAELIHRISDILFAAEYH